VLCFTAYSDYSEQRASEWAMNSPICKPGVQAPWVKEKKQLPAWVKAKAAAASRYQAPPPTDYSHSLRADMASLRKDMQNLLELQKQLVLEVQDLKAAHGNLASPPPRPGQLDLGAAAKQIA
jgi:hypothetical protein